MKKISREYSKIGNLDFFMKVREKIFFNLWNHTQKENFHSNEKNQSFLLFEKKNFRGRNIFILFLS